MKACGGPLNSDLDNWPSLLRSIPSKGACAIRDVGKAMKSRQKNIGYGKIESFLFITDSEIDFSMVSSLSPFHILFELCLGNAEAIQYFQDLIAT